MAALIIEKPSGVIAVHWVLIFFSRWFFFLTTLYFVACFVAIFANSFSSTPAWAGIYYSVTCIYFALGASIEFMMNRKISCPDYSFWPHDDLMAPGLSIKIVTCMILLLNLSIVILNTMAVSCNFLEYTVNNAVGPKKIFLITPIDRATIEVPIFLLIILPSIYTTNYCWSLIDMALLYCFLPSAFV